MADATFVFADIAGFTALTEAHGDEEAVALVEAFTDLVRREVRSGVSPRLVTRQLLDRGDRTSRTCSAGRSSSCS